MSLFAFAPAKVNLNLHVLGQNNKGYHLLDSLVVFTDFGDEIHVQKAEHTTYSLKGAYGGNHLLMDEDNLVVKAHKALEKAVKQSLPCRITLVKNLPLAAGVGGGSSDGATTLKLLNKLFACGLCEEELSAIGLTLGADFPVCLHGKTCFMSGIGEKITPISHFPKLFIGLINPKKPTPTKQVFAHLNKSFSHKLFYADSFSLQNLFPWLKTTHNDLQNPAISLVPEIESILQKFSDFSSRYPEHFCHYGMSGSGATCYIISPEKHMIFEAIKPFRPYDYIILHGKIK